MFRTDDGQPHVVRRFRGEGQPRRRLARRGGDGPGAPRRRPTATTPSRSACATRPATSAWRRARSRGAALARPGTGVSVRRFTLRGPLSAVTAGRVCPSRGRPLRPQLRLRVSRLGDPKAVPARRPGRPALPRPNPEQDANRRLPSCGFAPGAERAVWPLAVAGLPPPQRRAASPPAGGAAGAHLAGPQPRGRRRSTASRDRLPLREGGPARPAVRGRRPAAALRRRGLAAAALARSRAARVRPDHRPRPGSREGPALGNAPGVAFAGSELWAAAAADGSPARLRGRRRPRGVVRGGLVQAHDRPARRHAQAIPRGPGG